MTDLNSRANNKRGRPINFPGEEVPGMQGAMWHTPIDSIDTPEQQGTFVAWLSGVHNNWLHTSPKYINVDQKVY